VRIPIAPLSVPLTWPLSLLENDAVTLAAGDLDAEARGVGESYSLACRLGADPIVRCGLPTAASPEGSWRSSLAKASVEPRIAAI
jgi:hypothetical protein